MLLGTDLADEARRKDVRHKQPFLFAVGQLKQRTQYVMMGEQLSIPAGDSPITAIDALFKDYYCSNVELPLSVSQFGEFLIFEVYEIMDKRKQNHKYDHLPLSSEVWQQSRLGCIPIYITCVLHLALANFKSG